MKIDSEKCIFCLECIDYCPVRAILEKDASVSISQEECVECGVCLRANVCPTDAIYMPEESKAYPRSVRAQLSDPGVQIPKLKQGGRGTEEMKTNDVTGRYRRGELGMTLEFGRPGTGTRISEIEKIAKVLCSMGIEIEEANPVFGFLTDKQTGQMKPEVLKEKVLSAILEFKIREDRLPEVIQTLTLALKEVNTVVSWGLISRVAEDGTIPVLSKLKELNLAARPNAKINMGLGRPIFEE